MLERITRREEADLFVSWIAISFAFAIIFLRDIGQVAPVTALIYLGISLLTVGVGFILHEMAHKFVAIKYGYWAEFRKDNIMLVVAVALAALVGVVFAAPGATVIYSNSADGRGTEPGREREDLGFGTHREPHTLHPVCRDPPAGGPGHLIDR